MSPLLAALFLAVLFTAFALLSRRAEPRGGCSTHACPDEGQDACAGCDLAPRTLTEANDDDRSTSDW